MTDNHKHKKTLEEEKREMDEGDTEEEIYSEAARMDLMEDEDEITDLDEGFMKGYDEGGKMTKCPVCSKILEDDFVEKEIDNEVYRFCSDEHAEKYTKEHLDHKEEIEVGEEEEEDSDLEEIEKEKKILKKTR